MSSNPAGSIPRDSAATQPRNSSGLAEAGLPLGRLGTIDDIGHAVAYLVSDDAAYVTGSVLRVDGGFSLPRPEIFPNTSSCPAISGRLSVKAQGE